jgi:aryl-alcohol dehydrogenase-like predicted oxidoreductase
MLYRSFSKCGARVSAVSFGAMRWPSEEACFRIVNRGLDLGLNYVDCSTGYVGGQSLPWVGRAVAKRRGEILFSCKSTPTCTPWLRTACSSARACSTSCPMRA